MRVAWVAVVLLAVAVGGYIWLTPHVEPHFVLRLGDVERRAHGWEVLKPWAAWPVLAAYGAPVIVLACALGWVIAKIRMTEEHQAIAEREAAAGARMQEARRIQDEGEGITRQAQAALEQVAEREREAEARIEAAEFRLKRSVETNIGLRRQLQKLKAKGESATMGHC